MTRFRIEFEGRTTAASRDEADAVLELVRHRLEDLWVADPATSADVVAVEVRVSFVLEATGTQEALDGGHALLAHAVADTDLATATWTAARAERDDPAT